MSEHDEGRRAFLRGTAIGAGAAASVALVPQGFAKDLAKDHQHVAQANSPPDQGMAHQGMAGMGGRHGAFFNVDDSRTIAAFTERLMPGAQGLPGATDAGVLNYIDLALAGPYADEQYFYRCGLTQLDAHCTQTYGKPFRSLGAAQQDETIAALEQGKAPAFAWPTAQAFFNAVHKHTIEGMFSDPIYGGNKDFAGWRLVGFPGAQPQYTPEDLQSREAFTREPIVGLQARAKSVKG
jgi:gluconate 2-dehydrogenase gamma chain